MANPEHLEILHKGVKEWNSWRKKFPKTTVDLSGADLRRFDLEYADEMRSTWKIANFSNIDLTAARLHYANLSGVRLNGANFSGAGLINTDFCGANLTDTIWENAVLGFTFFGLTNLKSAKGLETCKHQMASCIDYHTIMASQPLPEAFLLGCGLSGTLIQFLPSISNNPIEFYSCFISYSSKDEEFARRLHERMRAAGLRVWFAPEHAMGGKKLLEQIEHAIQMHDRLLLVLSDHSILSEWVMTEIRRAREAERKEGHRKLFPIRLTDFKTLEEWKCPDSKSGQDLAEEVRQYFIPDFSNWKNHDDFEKTFDRLLRDLKGREFGH
jgi:hypothetical protein